MLHTLLNKFKLNRAEGGMANLEASSRTDFIYKLGQAHATDRMVQMYLVKIIGEGEISTHLKDDNEARALDIFMHDMQFAAIALKEYEQLPQLEKEFLQHYCDGVNAVVKKRKRPFEFRLVKYYPPLWLSHNCLLIATIMSYIGLAQTQQDCEKLIIQLIQKNLSIPLLKSLFSPHINAITNKEIDLIKQVHLHEPIVDKNIEFLNIIPKMQASNNWSLGPEKTTTGSAIHCSDPHLEVNRLPAIWYEVKADFAGSKYFGVTVPGLPGIIMGRNQNVAFGFTYGFMDMIDYFIEEIKDDCYLLDDKWTPIKTSKKTIHSKNSSFDIWIRETVNGTIEFDNTQKEIPNGYYLSRNWSGRHDGPYSTISALFEMLEAKTIDKMQEAVRKTAISCNWILSDNFSNITYQQSGCFPHRSHSGIYPVVGNHKENRWQGLRPLDDLGSLKNPAEGFLITANNNLNQSGKPLSINLPMGEYRALRIKTLLERKEKYSIKDMQEIQTDLYSNQAEFFLKKMENELKNDHSKIAQMLRDWDCNYDKNSFAATIFEYFYFQLLQDVFGEQFMGTKVFDYLKRQTTIFVDFYAFFDRILLADPLKDDSLFALWFKEKPQLIYFKEALEKTSQHFTQHKLLKWGEEKKTFMNNIFFDGKLPKWTKLDYGPIPIQGSRATIVQGCLYESHGRTSTFCPSWRFITTLNSDECYSILAGGPSENFLSPHYRTDIKKWLNFEYKKVNLKY